MKKTNKLFNRVLTALIVSASLFMFQGFATASEAGFPLDKAPNRVNNLPALQNGAKLFVNYCLNCHGATSMRYNRLRDIGLTDEQIKQNLLFTGEKVGDLMKVSISPKDAKEWFGATPPDLSVEARARGNDWLYTYLRTFYKDETRATGWNNMTFKNVGMPHVMWELQGERIAKFEERLDPHDPSKMEHVFVGFEQVTPGKMKPQEFDENMADLVAFMAWMAEPVQLERKRIGVIVLMFLAVFTLLAWRLNKAYWKAIR